MEQSITIRNHMSELSGVESFVEAYIEAIQAPFELGFNLNLILNELITNIVSYGYEDATEHLIDIHLHLIGDEVAVVVKDDGLPFDPLSASEPPLEQPLEERPLGGMGIFLVRQLASQVHYAREDGHNVLAMRLVVTEGADE